MCSTAIDAEEATVKSIVKPVPAVSVSEPDEPNIPIMKSLAFNAVTPVARIG